MSVVTKQNGENGQNGETATVSRIIADLERAGVTLAVNGDRLRWRAPEGEMMEARVEALRRHKADVMATLETWNAGPGAQVEQGARLGGGLRLHKPRRVALSPVPLIELYPTRPGDEWLAEPWYALRRRVR